MHNSHRNSFPCCERTLYLNCCHQASVSSLFAAGEWFWNAERRSVCLRRDFGGLPLLSTVCAFSLFISVRRQPRGNLPCPLLVSLPPVSGERRTDSCMSMERGCSRMLMTRTAGLVDCVFLCYPVLYKAHTHTARLLRLSVIVGACAGLRKSQVQCSVAWAKISITSFGVVRSL